MKRIEGSADGINWFLFATTNDMSEARQAASKCVLHTKHTQVRITEASQ